jgi:hypothetical protein
MMPHGCSGQALPCRTSHAHQCHRAAFVSDLWPFPRDPKQRARDKPKAHITEIHHDPRRRDQARAHCQGASVAVTSCGGLSIHQARWLNGAQALARGRGAQGGHTSRNLDPRRMRHSLGVDEFALLVMIILGVHWLLLLVFRLNVGRHQSSKACQSIMNQRRTANKIYQRRGKDKENALVVRVLQMTILDY